MEKYRIRNKVETLHRNIDTNNEFKIENKYKSINKLPENKIINDRGYDIINQTLFNENNKIYKNKKFKIMSDWEKLKLFADEKNSTFDKKKIYKSMYDKSDVNENYRNYLMKRNLKLKELSPLGEDPLFKVSAENENKRNNNSFTKTFNYSNRTENNLRNNTIQNNIRRKRENIIYKFNHSNVFNKKNFYENNRNILDYDNKDSIPVLVDKNVNTRYFKNYIARLRKK